MIFARTNMGQMIFAPTNTWQMIFVQTSAPGKTVDLDGPAHDRYSRRAIPIRSPGQLGR